MSALVKILADVAAGACALLFLAAALGKLNSWGQWSRLTADVPGPAVLGRVVRFAVPAAESTIVVLTVGWPIAGLATGAVVLAVLAFGVWILARTLLTGRECNCFGAIAPAAISQRLAGRNIALAALAVAGWYLAAHEHLQARSFSNVVATMLFGVLALLLVQSRSLWAAARAVRQREEV